MATNFSVEYENYYVLYNFDNSTYKTMLYLFYIFFYYKWEYYSYSTTEKCSHYINPKVDKSFKTIKFIWTNILFSRILELFIYKIY